MLRGKPFMRSLADDERLKLTLSQACTYCGSWDDLSVDHLISKKLGDRITARTWSGSADRGLEALSFPCRGTVWHSPTDRSHLNQVSSRSRACRSAMIFGSASGDGPGSCAGGGHGEARWGNNEIRKH